MHITHWTSKDLARQAVADGIVTAISPRTVRQILKEADLQPHRTRYWKTAQLDEQFKQRAEQVLWCYAHAERLARQGIWVVAADEKPNHQVLERNPIRRAIPGSIEQQEFEYTRHGTVNLLFFLIVHSGRMEVAAEDSKDAEHYISGIRSRGEGDKRNARGFVYRLSAYSSPEAPSGQRRGLCPLAEPLQRRPRFPRLLGLGRSIGQPLESPLRFGSADVLKNFDCPQGAEPFRVFEQIRFLQ